MAATGRSVERRAIPQLGVERWSRGSRLAGFSVVALLIVVTVFGYAQGDQPGPQIKPFIAICATIWAFAELLTAFLLLSQFYVAGRLSFAMIAAAYIVSGLLTIPYLVFFPGVFSERTLTSGDLQISAWLWVAWHLLFPVMIAGVHLLDPTLDRVTVPRAQISRALGLVLAVSALVAAAVFAATFLARDWLPVFIVAGGHFGAVYKSVALPLIIVVNGLAIVTVALRARRLSPLQTWLSVALLTMLLDSLLNLWSPARYSMSWYVGKFEALVMSTVVLAMLLLEVATLYRRLYDVATIDVLTGLPNRRRFIEVAANTLAKREMSEKGIAMLVIDVDDFKTYNDRYGHLAGDDALAAVAGTFRGSLVRAYDSVARYGGEEFVILLPEVNMNEAEAVAERVRRRVSKLGIVHERNKREGHLTVSVGVGYCSGQETITERVLFDSADQALYEAKADGRNCVAVRLVLRDGATIPAIPAVSVA
jgi:diguanylate cyclase (GGDEF)-like protein